MVQETRHFQMELAAKSYVRKDEAGVMRVGETRVTLDSVIYPFRHGDSAESIRSQYPSLTLEEVYGAIAYYLGHRDEVDTYLEQQESLWDELRAKSDANLPPVVQRLRALKAARDAEPRK
jgi:uncharacterized protein (DUF433 family)